MARYFTIVRIALVTTAWTDVIPPDDCSRVRIFNEDASNVVYLRSDRGNAGSQITIQPSTTYPIESGSPETPFQRGTVVCSLIASSGTGPAVAQFIR
jgi:hypothetical protein